MILNDTTTDPNQLLPIKYSWARECYKNGIKNSWFPEEISLTEDSEQWKSDLLTDDERRMIMWNLGFFSTAESLTANNLVLSVYKHISDAACRQYLLRQAFEEAVHVDTFFYVTDTLCLDRDKVFEAYRDIESIKQKDDFVINFTKSLLDPNFSTQDIDGVKNLLRDLVGFYHIMEGLFFYAGFCMMASLQRRRILPGTTQQFEFIARDESVHLAFGCELVNTIKYEFPEAWTNDLQEEIIEFFKTAVNFEKKYAFDACPRGVMGINPDSLYEYIEYIADRRLERLSLPRLYNTQNPFPWMSSFGDLKKEKNFFETTVTEYQSGSLNWD